MRKLYWALPFLVYMAVYLFFVFTFPVLIATLFSWAAFLLEYRYGTTEDGGELVAFLLIFVSLLMPIGGIFSRFAEVAAAFLFFLELAVAFLRTHFNS